VAISICHIYLYLSSKFFYFILGRILSLFIFPKSPPNNLYLIPIISGKKIFLEKGFVQNRNDFEKKIEKGFGNLQIKLKNTFKWKKDEGSQSGLASLATPWAQLSPRLASPSFRLSWTSHGPAFLLSRSAAHLLLLGPIPLQSSFSRPPLLSVRQSMQCA
jgi:hypothetical protein